MKQSAFFKSVDEYNRQHGGDNSFSLPVKDQSNDKGFSSAHSSSPNYGFAKEALGHAAEHGAWTLGGAAVGSLFGPGGTALGATLGHAAGLVFHVGTLEGNNSSDTSSTYPDLNNSNK